MICDIVTTNSQLFIRTINYINNFITNLYNPPHTQNINSVKFMKSKMKYFIPLGTEKIDSDDSYNPKPYISKKKFNKFNSQSI